jgi:hypothetical protein
MLSLDDFLPYSLVSLSRFLEGVDGWFNLIPGEASNGTPTSAVSIKLEKIKAHPGSAKYIDSLNLIFDIQDSFGSHEAFLMWLNVKSVGWAAKNGIKLFSPTEDQFEAMRHVEMTLPINDYAQPYPTMFVEVPGKVRATIAKEFSVDPNRISSYVLLHSFKSGAGNNCVFTCFPSLLSLAHVANFMNGDNENSSIEEIICRWIEHQVLQVPKEDVILDNGISETLFRASMNLIVMLMGYGHKEQQTIRPAKMKKPTKIDLDSPPLARVLLSQDVVVSKTEKHEHSGIPTGKNVAAHWRRGHWRNQAFGPNYSQHKKILIAPVLIHKEYLTDPSKINVTMTLK